MREKLETIYPKLKAFGDAPWQIVRFIIAGGLSALVEVSSLILLVEINEIHYLTSNVISFVLANIFNFVLSRNWVFLKGRHSPKVEFLAFFTVAGIGLALNQTVMWLLVDSLYIDYKITKIVAIIVTVVWNFLARKTFVFKR